MEIMENAFVTPKKNSGKKEEDNDCKDFNLEGNYESQTIHLKKMN
jgi:hypothetical protein